MRPMLATPTARVPQGAAWRHEVKWDGVRALVHVKNGRVHLETRSGGDCSAAFPEITGSPLGDFDDIVLDGETVALLDGRPDFRAVMHRLAPRGGGGGRTRAGAGRLSLGDDDERERTAGAPIVLMAFDVLRAAGHDLVAMPWQARRELLEGALGGLDSPVVQVPPAHDDGAALFEATLADGFEGIVSKRVDSRYHPGVRSEDWLKSVHRTVDSFVVGGWRPLRGRTATLGALLVGEMTPEGLRCRGRVGTGFSRASGQELLAHLTPSDHCPFEHDTLPDDDVDGTHWVAPDVVIDVSHLGRSAGGRLRQPSYKGMRFDLGALS